jgi:RNA polymerase sigma factor (sigma-70 family)
MQTVLRKERYQNPALRRLGEEQFEGPPPADLLQRVDRAEKLLAEIDPQRTYNYMDLYQAVTGRAPSAFRDTRVSGRDARHDLLVLVEELSDRARVRVESAGERVLSVDELAKLLNVSTKTISRWRRRGLVSRRFIFDHRSQVGFLESSVRRFIATNTDRVERGARFSQMTPEEREAIPEQARRMATAGLGPAEVMRRLAEATQRSVETIRTLLRQYDRQHPETAVFPNYRGPLDAETKRKIHQLYQRGESVDDLARQFGRTKQRILEVFSEVRAERVLGLPLDFIPSTDFTAVRTKAQDRALLGPPPEGQPGPHGRPPSGLPPYLAGLYEVPLLTREQEAHLFRKMNYLKYKASKLRAQLDPARPKVALMDRIEKLYGDSVTVKNQIISSNLRLVVSIAKRHAGSQHSFFELVSDGNMSLMRAVEKFNYSLGYKFSTYASWAIMKNFSRSIPDEMRRQRRFQTGITETFAAALDDRTDPHDMEQRHERHRHQVDRILQRLDKREQEIIVRRFGLERGHEPLTLKQVGAELGVTKERIRQIESRAMGKLRAAAVNERLVRQE